MQRDDLEKAYADYRAEFERQFPNVHVDTYLIQFVNGKLLDRMKALAEERFGFMISGDLISVGGILTDNMERASLEAVSERPEGTNVQ